MDLDAIAQQIAVVLGSAWASGINLYAAMLTMGYMHVTGMVVLPPGLEILAHPLVMGAAFLMFVVEFIADKIPGIDTAWDGIHTFVRLPAGIMMAYGAAEGMGPAIELASALVGGGVVTAAHATKAGGRVLINTSPEPITNWTASITEDLAVIGGVWAALQHPWWFLGAFVVFVLLLIWLLPRIWRGIKKVFGFIFRLFGGQEPAETEDSSAREP